MSDLAARGFRVEWEYVSEFHFRKRVAWEAKVSAQYPDDWLVFLDPFDSVVLAEGPDEVQAELERLGSGPIFSADTVCWPLDVKSKYNERQAGTHAAKSPWRFVNGSGPAGRGREISRAVSYLMAQHPLRSDTMSDIRGNDQAAWTTTYLDGHGKVDSECRLVQSMLKPPAGCFTWDGTRLHNTVTNSRPCFLHLCGHSDAVWDGVRGVNAHAQ